MLSAIAKFQKPDIEKTLVTHYLLSQYGMNKTVKMFGDCGVMVVHRELDQIHDRKMIQQRLPRELTAAQNRKYLS